MSIEQGGYEWEQLALPDCDYLGAYRDVGPDMEAVLRLRFASGDVLGEVPDSIDDATVQASIEHLRDSASNIFACRDAQGGIAAAMITQQNGEHLRIASLAVRERSRTKGLGTSALRFVSLLAREQGIQKIVGDATPNPRTLAFYQKNGFNVGEPGDEWTIPILGYTENVLRATTVETEVA